MNTRLMYYINFISLTVALVGYYVFRPISGLMVVAIALFNFFVINKSNKAVFANKTLVMYNLAYLTWIMFLMFFYMRFLDENTVVKYKEYYMLTSLIPMFCMTVFSVKIFKKVLSQNKLLIVFFDLISWFVMFATFQAPVLVTFSKYKVVSNLETIFLSAFLLLFNIYVTLYFVYRLKYKDMYYNSEVYSNLFISGIIFNFANVTFIIRNIFKARLLIFEIVLIFIFVILTNYSVNYFMTEDRKLRKKSSDDFQPKMLSDLKHAIIPILILIVMYEIETISIYTLSFSFLLLVIDLNINLYYYSQRTKDFFVKKVEFINSEMEYEVKLQTEKLLDIKERLLAKINTDSLTGLYSLEYYYTAFENLAVEDDSGFSMIFINIDDFRSINNTYTYEVGDKLLVSIANRLKNKLSADKLIFRLLSDEFMVCFSGASMSIIKSVIVDLEKMFKEPFTIDGHKFLTGFSLSVVRYPVDSKEATELLQLGMVAMYKAKKSLKNESLIFYSGELVSEILRSSKAETTLRDSAIENDFYIRYHFRYSKSSSEVMSISLSMGCKNSSFRDVELSEIVALSEKVGIHEKLSKWYVKNFILKYIEVSRHCETKPYLCVDVDFSAPQFIRLMRTCNKASNSVFNGEVCVEFYISSDLLQELHDEHFYVFEELKNNNMKISIKNFGVGFLSFHIIKKCGVSGFVISKELIDSVDINTREYNIVKSITALSKKLKISVIARDIERLSQFKALSKLGVDYYEGDYIMHSMSYLDTERAG